MNTGAKTVFILRCKVTGESQEVVVCQKHALEMPVVNGENVTTRHDADDSCPCDFCHPHTDVLDDAQTLDDEGR